MLIDLKVKPVPAHKGSTKTQFEAWFRGEPTPAMLVEAQQRTIPKSLPRECRFEEHDGLFKVTWIGGY